MPMANPITDNVVNFVTTPSGVPADAGRQSPVGGMTPTNSDKTSHYIAGVVIVAVAVLAALHFLGFRFVASAGAGFGN